MCTVPFATSEPDAPPPPPRHELPRTPPGAQLGQARSTADSDEYETDTDEEPVQPEKRPESAVNNDLFKSLEDRNLSYDAAFALIESVVRNLRKLKSVANYNAAIGFFFLNKYVSSTTEEKRRKPWVDKLNECGIAELCKQLWPAFENPDFLATTAAGSAQKSFSYQSFHFLWSILWNGSDCSYQLCKAIVNNDLVELNLQLLNRHDFKPEALSADSERQWIIKACLGMMHNCLRLNTLPSKKRLRANNCIEILKRYLTSDVALVRTKASIILAYVAEENEMEIIDSNDDIIRICVRVLLEPALRSPKRRSLGFSVEETVDALNALAKHDENKRRMVKAGVINMYMFIIKKPYNESELLHAVKGLWMLSFITESVDTMKKTESCISALTTLKSHRNGLVGRAAAGALWNINGAPVKAPRPRPAAVAAAATRKAPAEDKPSTPGTVPEPAEESVAPVLAAGQVAHIMISYDHGHKEVVHKLNVGLRAHGYTTWVDSENMQGSTLDAMAAAVESASVILLCFSERYQESPNCRLEAEYAFKMQKDIVPVRTERYKPTGWLSMLLGSKFWVNCYEESDVTDALPKIIKELGGRGKGGVAPPSVANPKTDTSAPAPKPTAGGAKPLEQWSQQEVQRWLVKNDLGHIGGKLAKFDGALMAQFRSMYRNSPGVQFYDSAKSFLGIADLADLLKLTQKLEYI